jgi:hypothetical protein
MRRCTQVHVGYTRFPAGTWVKWKVIQEGKLVAVGGFSALGGGGTNHFLTQPIGARVKASPSRVDLHFSWTINGVLKTFLRRVSPGCSGTALNGGPSGLGHFFTVSIRNCRRLHVGYQYFPKNTAVAWAVMQNGKGRMGFFVAAPGSTFQYYNALIPMQLTAGKAVVQFLWQIDGNWYRYRITRPTEC